MKKALTIILALALVMSLSVPAFAADNEYTEKDKEGKTDISFTISEPTYTVTIPASVALNYTAGTDTTTNLPITVSDSENLNGRSIVITVEATNDLITSGALAGLYQNCLYPADPVDGNDRIPFDFASVEDDAGNMGQFPSGYVLVTFSADGVKNIGFIMQGTLNSSVRPGVAYTGWIQFGIGLKK